MWCVLLLSSLAVAAVAAHEKQMEDDVSDIDEDMGLDEEELKVLMAEEEDEEEEEEATVMDEDHSDETNAASEKASEVGTDANISFQVRNGS